MNIGAENEAASFISGNICFEFSVQCRTEREREGSDQLRIMRGQEQVSGH